MERDIICTHNILYAIISTHTLTWSVTGRRAAPPAIGAISTHTLTWSVTGRRKCPFHLSAISTHTLTWSVTDGDLTHVETTPHFNSHAHVERDNRISGYIYNR